MKLDSGLKMTDILSWDKTIADLYEGEVFDNNEIYHKAPNIQDAAHLLNTCSKLLDAYRSYGSVIETYVPK
ncbi:MAG: hypothetical protein M3044_22740 [Thermoproteota archaeon]|nr:hypothetical protein [Thermoproteota archaeon]